MSELTENLIQLRDRLHNRADRDMLAEAINLLNDDTAGLREAMGILNEYAEASDGTPQSMPYFCATNALLNTIAIREGKSIKDVVVEFSQRKVSPGHVGYGTSCVEHGEGWMTEEGVCLVCLEREGKLTEQGELELVERRRIRA